MTYANLDAILVLVERMSMKYGISVSGDEWNLLMDRARERASISNSKVSVKAMINSERMAKVVGGKYSYIILSSEGADFVRRCAKTGPNGKPCLLPDKSHSVTHLSRGFDKDTYVAWYFLTDRDAPTSVETNHIHSSHYTKDNLKNAGFANYAD